jgi:hypothetical protein
MKRLAYVCALLFSLLSTAANATTNIQGNACTPAPGSGGSNLIQGNYGWYNQAWSATANTLWCGLSTQAGGGARSVILTVYDRNATPGTGDFSCELWGFDVNATLVYDSAVKASSGWGSGSQVLNMSTNNMGQTIPNSATFYSLQCTIPPASANGVSHVSLIAVD